MAPAPSPETLPRSENHACQPLGVRAVHNTASEPKAYRQIRSKALMQSPSPPPGKLLPDTKRPPGNRAAPSLGRIVPTEAKPSELSGCILSLAQTGVKAKTLRMHILANKPLNRRYSSANIRFLFVVCHNRIPQTVTI